MMKANCRSCLTLTQLSLVQIHQVLFFTEYLFFYLPYILGYVAAICKLLYFIILFYVLFFSIFTVLNGVHTLISADSMILLMVTIWPCIFYLHTLIYMYCTVWMPSCRQFLLSDHRLSVCSSLCLFGKLVAVTSECHNLLWVWFCCRLMLNLTPKTMKGPAINKLKGVLIPYSKLWALIKLIEIECLGFKTTFIFIWSCFHVSKLLLWAPLFESEIA